MQAERRHQLRMCRAGTDVVSPLVIGERTKRASSFSRVTGLVIIVRHVQLVPLCGQAIRAADIHPIRAATIFLMQI